jgi:hypothetical protein
LHCNLYKASCLAATRGFPPVLYETKGWITMNAFFLLPPTIAAAGGLPRIFAQARG